MRVDCKVRNRFQHLGQQLAMSAASWREENDRDFPEDKKKALEKRQKRLWSRKCVGIFNPFQAPSF